MGNPNPEPPLYYSVREAARLLGVGRTTVYELFKSGELKSVRDRGRRLVPREALLEYDARRKAAAGWDAPNAAVGPSGRAGGPKPAGGARAAVAAYRPSKRGDGEARAVGRSEVPPADDLGKQLRGGAAIIGASGLIGLDGFQEFVRSRCGPNVGVEVAVWRRRGHRAA